jgi:uncharacterized membrane protein YsdA (DUF1294 family)
MIPALAAYLLLVNLTAFMAFASDKGRARRGDRRIAEHTLLALAAVGGGLGAALGQRLLRHKTRKEPFRSRLRLILALQGLTVLLLAAQGLRLIART